MVINTYKASYVVATVISIVLTRSIIRSISCGYSLQPSELDSKKLMLLQGKS